MTFENDSESNEFGELVHFMKVITGLLEDCVEILQGMNQLPEEIALSLSSLAATIGEQSSEIIRNIVSNEYRNQLIAHGLNSSSIDWQFKYALFRVRFGRFRDSTAVKPRNVKSAQNWLRRIGAVFKPANVILRSLAAAIPGVAGAFNEIKDGMEVAADIGSRGRPQ